jgi:hypothetical protein
MGYDFHITRRDDWADEGGPEISSEEWLKLVEADPRLRLEPRNGAYFALFGKEAWFDWTDGQVFAKNPDQATLRKMLEIADQLGAKVQGDDGEFYDSEWQFAPQGSGRNTKAAWIEFLYGSIVPFAAMILVSALVFMICYVLFLRD